MLVLVLLVIIFALVYNMYTHWTRVCFCVRVNIAHGRAAADHTGRFLTPPHSRPRTRRELAIDWQKPPDVPLLRICNFCARRALYRHEICQTLSITNLHSSGAEATHLWEWRF